LLSAGLSLPHPTITMAAQAKTKRERMLFMIC
jgi:hypothetical protein